MTEFLKSFSLVILSLVLLYVIYTALSYLRMKKARKYYYDLQNELKVGDEVVFLGGVYGKVVHLSSDIAKIDVGSGNVLKVKRESISSKVK
ncbi:MAG: preprotein translocase subunit YajC [Peptoniphilaceae bacterium]|nr:preprotein translocase subunit YajC [Peptoniphilaceae bacterium]MDD7383945.1 preprotein translocase subunit YajC [Peptoniphilaceae bacterium]MDY3738088.1 preprotein translocase subunit YajC [Peptoniphilaceae bacterium]